jgi:hypothetical protein
MAIAEHADIQRMLLDMAAKVEVLRGLVIAASNQADLAAHEKDAEAREDAAALLQWLLPIVKTTGGEYAFDVASDAIQVLGGAGYTREWPAEQSLRDARVLTIFEGTTGIQALDIVHRRVRRGDRRGLTHFLSLAREEGDARLTEALDLLEHAAATLIDEEDIVAVDSGATAFLHLAQAAATGWIAARLAKLDHKRLAAAGSHWLTGLADRARLAHADAIRGAATVEGFAAILP